MDSASTSFAQPPSPSSTRSPTPAERLRARLAAPESSGPVVGTFLKLASAETVELARAAGFDFVVVDREHSQLSAGEARRLVRAAAAIGLPALVRLPEVDAGEINRVLEAGAAGIQLSTVQSAAEVAALEAATRYPPDGRRSVSLAHPVAGFGAQPLASYIAESKAAPPVLVGQIETATTNDPLDAIVAGLDVVFVGPTDLTVDLGVPGQLDHGRVQQRITEIVDAAQRSAAVLGAWFSQAAGGAAVLASTARYVVVGSDVQLLGGAFAGVVAAVRDEPAEG